MKNKKKRKSKSWREYLWIVSLIYLFAGLFNILFAWLGLLCFLIPLLLSVVKGEKTYCNNYCGRGQLLNILGNDFKLSKRRKLPKFLKSKFFRNGFLIFFLTMFLNLIFLTFKVYQNADSLREVITLFWTFKLPWNWTDISFAEPWIAQFAFGFYSLMLTSTLIGIISMLVYKPRSWCVYCPMGTMTQHICKLKNNKKV